MLRKFIIACFLAYAPFTFAQHRENEDVIKKMEWDDQMLNILLDTRFDLQNTIQNHDVNNRSFYGDILKVWFTGSITPNIHYRLRQRLNRAQDPNSRDGLSGATDHAWISFDFDENWTITVGKQALQFGTFENNYSSADVYSPTMIYNDLDSAEIGVNVAYKWNNQVFNIQAVNAASPQFASAEYENKALGYNFLWQGDLFDKVINTRWGYGLYQHNKDKFYSWLTLGTQVNVQKFTTEIDYYLGDRNMDYGTVVDNTTLGLRYVQDQAISLKFIYDLGDWKPFIKGVWSQRHDNTFGDNAYDILGVEGVVEWYPFKNDLLKNLRFHAAYSYSSTQFDGQFSSMTDKNQNKVLIGMRWMFKVK